MNLFLRSLKSMNHHYIHGRTVKQWYITCVLRLYNATITIIVPKIYKFGYALTF